VARVKLLVLLVRAIGLRSGFLGLRGLRLDGRHVVFIVRAWPRHLEIMVILAWPRLLPRIIVRNSFDLRMLVDMSVRLWCQILLFSIVAVTETRLARTRAVRRAITTEVPLGAAIAKARASAVEATQTLARKIVTKREATNPDPTPQTPLGEISPSGLLAGGEEYGGGAGALSLSTGASRAGSLTGGEAYCDGTGIASSNLGVSRTGSSAGGEYSGAGVGGAYSYLRVTVFNVELGIG
tara:strand:+ start:2707 stop:3420 length:714 start_codon:yes stop_codon:yes gene_type:complete